MRLFNLVLFACSEKPTLNAHCGISILVRFIICTHIAYGYSQCFGQSTRLCRLTIVFVVRKCDKYMYQNLMSWHNWKIIDFFSKSIVFMFNL